MKINTFINLIKFYNSYLTRISIVLGYLIIFIFFYISIFSNPFTSKNHNIYVDDQYRVPSRDDILNNIEQAYNIEYLDAYGSYLICDTSFISEGIVSVFDYYSYDSAAEAEDEGEVHDDVPIDSLKNYDVHPLPFLTRSITNNDLFILGTNAKTSEIGKEGLYEMISTFKNTFYLAIYSLSGFLFFGLL